MLAVDALHGKVLWLLLLLVWFGARWLRVGAVDLGVLSKSKSRRWRGLVEMVESNRNAMYAAYEQTEAVETEHCTQTQNRTQSDTVDAARAHIVTHRCSLRY